jgi:hypothetical protein
MIPPMPDGPLADECPNAWAGSAGKSDMSDDGNAAGERPLTLETRLDDLETEGRAGAIEDCAGAASACGESLAAFCCTISSQLGISLSQRRGRKNLLWFGLASTTAKLSKANFATLLSRSRATGKGRIVS